ncbi:MAG: cytochrome b/b6 domain-containing protein [Candidatus Thiodiazotropha taylori]|nr:cytochrome b/b6 domain-containing protein [Candidatus Thiodiazotropha taylori]MCW4234238.1 cytochrome b/b6 domain-containing protein [Candidatus Thiodiazotropha taylori]
MAMVKLYAGFERFWHWSQAALVILMLITGFEIHGTFTLLGWEQAAEIHRFAAWTLIGLWAFAWFWHLTTGEWKQYIPSPMERILAMVKYCAFEVCQGEGRPFHKDRSHKHNPLQRSAYLGLHLFIGPAIWISGLLYLFYGDLGGIGLEWLPLGAIALIHTGAAFLMLTFLVAHLYLAITMSDPPGADVKAMITGYEEVED